MEIIPKMVCLSYPRLKNNIFFTETYIRCFSLSSPASKVCAALFFVCDPIYMRLSCDSFSSP